VKTRITDLYGIEHPILSGAMAFVSLPPLVAAVSDGGGLGSLANGILPPEGLRAMIQATRRLTSRPFAVNFITQFATDEHIDVCLDEAVPFVEFFWTHPADTFVERLKDKGVKVAMKVATVADARAAVAAGVDAIIAQSSAAGGHTKGKIGTFALVPAVVDACGDVPVIAAGGVADGRGLVAALALGAEGVVVGTRFLATPEATIHPEYQRRILAGGDEDIVLTSIFGPEWPSQPINCLRNRIVDEYRGRDTETPPQPEPPVSIGTTKLGPETYTMPKFSAILPTPETDGDFEEMCLTAGQCTPLVNDVVPAAEVIRRIVTEAEALLRGRLAV